MTTLMSYFSCITKNETKKLVFSTRALIQAISDEEWSFILKKNKLDLSLFKVAQQIAWVDNLFISKNACNENTPPPVDSSKYSKKTDPILQLEPQTNTFKLKHSDQYANHYNQTNESAAMQISKRYQKQQTRSVRSKNTLKPTKRHYKGIY